MEQGFLSGLRACIKEVMPNPVLIVKQRAWTPKFAARKNSSDVRYVHLQALRVFPRKGFPEGASVSLGASGP